MDDVAGGSMDLRDSPVVVSTAFRVWINWCLLACIFSVLGTAIAGSNAYAQTNPFR